MINNVVLVGRLTKDPDLKYTSNGTAVANFTVAVNRKKSGDGEQQADFINCQAWRKTAEALANYTKKGALVGVEGRIQTRSYDNSEGRKVYVTEVIADGVKFLDSKNNSNSSNNAQQRDGLVNTQNNYSNPSGSTYGSPAANSSLTAGSTPYEIDDDDLPF